MSFRRVILCFLLLLAIGGTVHTPPARAFEPVTMMILAPAAVRAVEIASPYIIKGFFNGMQGFLKMGLDIVDILKLPVGAVGCTLGAPFGFFGGGTKLLVEGAIAPFKLAWHAVTLPVMFCGVKVP